MEAERCAPAVASPPPVSMGASFSNSASGSAQVSDAENNPLVASGQTQGGGGRDNHGNNAENDPLVPSGQTQGGGGRDNHGNNVRFSVRFWRSLQRKFIHSTKMLKLNDELHASWMSYMANAAVMGILTLNIYSASYFLAWRKEGSSCHIFPGAPTPPNLSDSAAASNRTITTLIQLIVVSIPFTCLPMALGIGGFAKASKETVHFLECATLLVILEIMYVISLGAVMTSCISDVSGPSVARVTLVLLSLLLLLWGCCCSYPKCLRYAVLCKCCCSDIDDEQLFPEV